MSKKIFAIAAALFLAVALSTAAFASDWNDFVAKIRQQGSIDKEGRRIIAELRSEAPAGTEMELWRLLWYGYDRPRAAAAISLMDMIFPDGDPSRWQEVSGFITDHSFGPRQLAAMDALFTAVIVMSRNDDLIWGAASLLQRFGDSGMGKVVFIDMMPEGLRAAINRVIAATGLKGDWSHREVIGKLPLLPDFGGYISSDGAISPHMQFIDGAGRIAQNGRLVWDRKTGRILRIIERRMRFPWFFIG